MGLPKSVSLKSLSQLKEDIRKASARWAASEDDVSLQSCRASYRQLTYYLVPGVTCFGRAKSQDTKMLDDLLVIEVSLTKEFTFSDEILFNGLQTPTPSSTPPPSSCAYSRTDDSTTTCGSGDEGTAEFAMFQGSTSTTNSAYDSLNDFENEFGSITSWTDNGLHQDILSDAFLYPGTDDFYADESDLIYVVAHGTMRGVGSVYFRYPLATAARAKLGLSDAEFIVSAACENADVNYCYSRGAQSFFEDGSNDNSAFWGLHVFGGYHGTSYGGKGNVDVDFANYLDDGVAVAEAWTDSAHDNIKWYESVHCQKYNDTDTDGNGVGDCTRSEYNCDRYSNYSAAFYIRDFETETIKAMSGGTNPRQGDSSYDIGVYYWHNGNKPAYTEGYSLP